MTPRFFLLPLLSMLMAISMTAQQKDAALWMEYALAMKYKKKWEFSASPELRINNNISYLNRALLDLGMQYKINKEFFVGASYRTAARNKGDFFDIRERVQFGVGIRKEWRNFTFTYQPRYQISLQQITSEGDADFETTLRNKFTVKYNFSKKIKTSSSFELFNNSEPNYELRLENWRWKADFTYDLNKRNSISAGYMIQKAIWQSPQEMDYVVLVSYKTDINLSKKKKQSGESLPPSE